MSSSSDDARIESDRTSDTRPTRESVQLVTTADEFGGRANTMPPPERTSEVRSEQLLHPGDVVGGRYRVDSEIGRGGMAIVYAGTQLGSGRRVALKWLFESAANRGERRRRFLREARAASAVEHTNVVRVFDAGEHGSGVYLAMELLHGESLRVYLLQRNLSVPKAVDLIMPALRGVAAAHRQGVIHRDLKPDNLLVCTRDSGGPELKVLDFGLSKLLGGGRDSLHTLPGAMLGTPQYMAPEQIEGSGHVDERCDLYSMAAILYEAIAGRRPFEALTLADLLAKLTRDQPPPLRATARQLGKEVPVELSDAVMRALNRDPAQRYATVEDFAIAIEPFGTRSFHSTTAARAAYTETLRTRRPPERFALTRSPLARRVVMVWFAAIALTAAWLASRALLRKEPIEPGVHVAAPLIEAPQPQHAAPVQQDIAAPVRQDVAAPAVPAPSEAQAEPVPEGASLPAAPPAPRRSLHPRGVRRKPAATAPAPAPRHSSRSDIADPWQ